MFSHFVFGSDEPTHLRPFYNAVLAVLGFEAQGGDREALTYRHRGGLPWVVVRRPAGGRPFARGNGYHVAFHAGSEAAVQRFHSAALAAGGSDEGGPGLREVYAPDYYAAYVRDPDGNKLQAVTYLKGRKAGPGGDVTSHITLGSNDLKRACTFYTGVLATLGLARLPEEEDEEEFDYAFGHTGCRLPIVFPQLAFDGLPARPPQGSYPVLLAASRAQVDSFHRRGLQLGGADLGAPGETGGPGPAGYGAALADPDGNPLHALFPGS